ncbi:MAG: hypothetical protein GY855_01180 [candidate division Zixibacteria bacterium]|nr:hypothetical protein [candidate division Zixibacteria bacterium]
MSLLNRLLLSSAGLMILISVIAIAFITAVLLSYLFELSPNHKYLYLSGSALIIFYIAIRYIAVPFFRKINYSYLARRVEVFHPDLKDTLSAAIELKSNLQNNPEGYSVDLINAVIEDSSRTCSNLNFNKCVDKSPIKKRLKISTFFVLGALIVAVAYPSGFLYALRDFSSPSVKLQKPSPYIIKAVPGDMEVLKGDDVTIGARVAINPLYIDNGITPEEMNISWRYENSENYNSMPMANILNQEVADSSENLAFTSKFESVQRSFDYFLSTPKTISETYRVNVVDRPRIIDLKQRLYYPRYTRLPSVVIDENEGNIIALTGTRISLAVRCNKEIKQGKIEFENRETLPLEISGDSAAVSFTLKSDDSYHLRIVDIDGLTNPDPIHYKIFISPDSYPEVEVIRPGEDLLVGELENLPLIVRADDDFGFSSLKLVYQTKTSGLEQPEVIQNLPFIWEGEKEISVGYSWNFSGFGLIPGDEVVYYVKVWDNDSYSGYKSAESRRYSIRLPSVDQILSEFDNRRDENVAEFEEVIADQKKLNETVEELRREMLRLQETDWEKSKKIEESVGKQKDIADALDELQESISENLSNVEDNKLNSMDILEKSQKIAELIEELNSPELQEAIEKMQEALRNINQTDLKNALEDLQFSQEEYVERLEKTLEMLKRMRAEQKFDQLKELADKIAEQQAEISEESENANNEELNRLSEKQEQTEKNLDALNKGLEKMEEYNSESPVMPQESLEQLQEDIEESEIEEDMQESAQQMKTGNSKCQKSSQSAAQKARSISNQMSKMQQQMKSGQDDKVLKMLRKAFNDVIYISEIQEGLVDSLEFLDPRDSLIRFLTPEQLVLEQKTLQIRDEMDEIYEIEPRIDPSIATDLVIASGKMQGALSKLDLKSKSASKDQLEALKYLNRAGFKLVILLKPSSCMGGQGSGGGDPQNSGSSGSPSPQLSDLAKQQQGLNSSASQLANQIRRGVSHNEMMARMAAEQEAVRQGLRELLQSGGDGKDGQMGRLDDLGEEMKKVVDDYERNRVNRDTLKRQEQILTRLLDAQKSMRTQGHKKTRKAEAGEDIFRRGPGQLAETKSEIHGQLQRLREALKEDYPMEYRELIKSYITTLSERLSELE